jgi:hypothetical protein
MNIGLINIEPKIQNTAYMQIAYHHRQIGDSVEFAKNYDDYDKLYCSSLFDFTDKSDVPDNAICGGTGYDLTTKLPFDGNLDYSLYPDCDCSYIWLSRGCIRKCKFCVVHDKEGEIRPVKPKNLNPKGKYIQVQDNNFFASPEWKKAIWWLWEQNQPVDFQGVDVRLLTDEMCDYLKYTKHYKQLKIAWDNPRCTKTEKGIRLLMRYVRPSKIMCYVLTGYNSTKKEDLRRIRTLQELKITPYVMCMNRKDPRQKKFQKWVNGFAFRNVPWEEFKV